MLDDEVDEQIYIGIEKPELEETDDDELVLKQLE